MKKILFAFVALLSSVAIYAQKWTAASSNAYSERTPVLVCLQENGVNYAPASDGGKYEVAAFITVNGVEQCRATATRISYSKEGLAYYQLIVRGSTDEKTANAPISFKVYDTSMGYVYEPTPAKNAVFNGETYSYPFTINLVPITSFNLVNPITLTIGETKDLYPFLGITPENATPPTVEWGYQTNESANYFTIANGQITATAITPEAGAEAGPAIGLTANAGGNNFFRFQVVVNGLPIINFAGQTQEITVNQGNDLKRILPQYFTISNTEDHSVTYTSGNTSIVDANAIAQKVGTTTVTVTLNANTESSITFTVNVIIPLEGIVAPDMLSATVGDDVFALVREAVMLNPADATYDKANLVVGFAPTPAAPDYSVVNAQGVAVGAGTVDITVATDENGSNEKTIRVTVTNPLKSIAVSQTSLTVTKGDAKVWGQIENLVILTPANVSDADLTYTPTDATIVSANGAALKAGSTTVSISSATYPDVAPANITVIVEVPLTGFALDMPTEAVRFAPFTVTLTPDPADATFEASDINLTAVNMNLNNETWIAAQVIELSEDRLQWQVTPYTYGTLDIQVQKGELIMSDPQQIDVAADYSLKEGWNWLSIYQNDESAPSAEEFNNDNYFNGKLLDMRSCTQLFYNDPQWGIFGDIESLDENEMYKAKVTGDVSFSLKGGNKPNARVSLVKGYNWLVYPYAYNHSFAELSKIFANANEGDQIISKNGFIEYSNGTWANSENFTFEYGQGYLYYTEAENGLNISWNDEMLFPQNINVLIPAGPAGAPLHTNLSHWQYDPSRFMNNMTMVAQVENLDDASRYSIGAFVDGECRGESQLSGNKYFITVHADTKETVSFRIYDNETGAEYEMDETLPFQSKAGSVKAPVRLSSATMAHDIATGISSVTGAGNQGIQAEGIYDLNGRRVNEMTHGIYIVKTLENGKLVTKKVLK